MRFVSSSLVLCATFILLPLAAQAENVTVTGAYFDEQYETLTIKLSGTPARATLPIALYLNGDGDPYSTYKPEIRNVSTYELGGFRSQIFAPGGTSKGSLEVRVCLQDPTMTGTTDASCSAPYILWIDGGATGSFSDVNDDHANAVAIAYVHRKRIVSGYEDRTFHPDYAINRAEFTKIITLALYGQEAIDRCVVSSFSDVPPGEWFARYVCKARDARLLKGYPDGTFRPGQFINFIEAAKILANAYGLVQHDADCGGKMCPDLNSPDHPWYEQYVRALEAKHAIPPSILRFDQVLMRAEMAEMIYRLDAKIVTLSSMTNDNLLRMLEWDRKCSREIEAGGTCE